MMSEMRDDPHVTWFMRRWHAKPPGMPLEALLHELVERVRAEGYAIRVNPPSMLPETKAGKLEMLLEMMAPMTEQEDGTFVRDPSQGIISKEQFLELLEFDR